MAKARADVPIEGVEVSAFTIPTDEPESDGTFEWTSTTIVVVEVQGGGKTGLGYTYAHAAAASLVATKLAPAIEGTDATNVAESWRRMSAVLRNDGRPGLGMMSLSALDIALWDLNARLRDAPLVALVGAAQDAVPVYGSGGFTSYSIERLRDQLGGWVEQGIPRVKMKTSRNPAEDPRRLDAARRAIGDEAELYVDANGALSRKAALAWAERFRRDWGVSWFEEPVSSDDVEGLRLLRDRGPGGLDVAAGEYGYVLADFRRWLEAGAVDCLQADVTRCGGVTGVLRVSGLCDTHGVDLSAHCAPAASAHAFCGALHLRHLEYFHDHARLEPMLFDGTLDPRGGALRPDRSRPGLGLELRRPDVDRYRTRP